MDMIAANNNEKGSTGNKRPAPTAPYVFAFVTSAEASCNRPVAAASNCLISRTPKMFNIE